MNFDKCKEIPPFGGMTEKNTGAFAPVYLYYNKSPGLLFADYTPPLRRGRCDRAYATVKSGAGKKRLYKPAPGSHFVLQTLVLAGPATRAGLTVPH